MSNDTDQLMHSEKKYSLKNLYLDPNNYRFIDKNDYAECEESKLTDKNVQMRTLDLLRGKNNANISDLISSFKQSGFIPVDQIQVRKIDTQKYLVIEGNRRVAALKALEDLHNNSQPIGKLSPEIFKKVPVVDYLGDDPSMYKVLMGLKHISGNKKWPAINQAKLIQSLFNDHEMSEEEIVNSLGVSKIELRTTRRTLALINKYEDSDYGDQFSSDKYSTFREIIKSPKIKEWLDLSPNDLELNQHDEQNLYRLFSWISTTEEEIPDEDIDSEETQIIRQEPIIETALQIRELAKIISDEKALSNLETTRSLVDATLSSETLGKNKLENSLTLIKEQVNTAFNLSSLIDDKKEQVISESIRRLQALLVARNNSSFEDNSSYLNKKPINESVSNHFSKLRLEKFKRFINIEFNNLNKINIFAGINNAGKTSILEALFLLANLGDTKSVSSINRFRSKHKSDIKNTLAFAEIQDECSISATFNNSNINLTIEKTTESELENQSDFVGQVVSSCVYLDKSYNFKSHFFNKEIRHHANTNHTLCNSVISYSSGVDEEEIFKECYRKSVTNGAKNRVIEFIKINIDPEIQDIELSDAHNTFVVVFKNLDTLPLSQFGDGLQKIFFLGIKFSACANGILLLDEVENGIHKDLLINFTKLIQKLSESYNVQVFITSHSKECIDAFIANDFKNDEISAFALSESNEDLESFSGSELSELLDYINLDIRGTK